MEAKAQASQLHALTISHFGILGFLRPPEFPSYFNEALIFDAKRSKITLQATLAVIPPISY